ncbi:N-formylglutamate amidohydrolase [Aquincola sp. J276]|uniref:N-formylglutamate amidohydrolase n=1 Tax=Aquincola sp. J276 TaxID=2898432 RepID=UPI002150E3B0|nr:N-formylglutamate amidohydrolase [Aquincola sp. J276]MCR5867357.1 N-formylglutamate amidohydrolase [Aquincola sp. J276]
MTSRAVPHAATPFDPFVLQRPTAEPLPLIADSPHSGLKYPADFGYALPFDELRAGEDTDVDVLWQALPAVGGTLLAAEFPRSYIDPNRDAADLDAALLDGPWPGELKPSEKTRLGIGLVWRDAGHDGRQPIYSRKLSVAEVQARIATYHAPYQRTLLEEIEQAFQRHGAVWHLNLHSMPANSYEGLQIQTDKPLADVVLGNHDGRTCSEEFTQLVAEAMRRRGLGVAFNDPFKGVALIARIGRPAERRHSLQIELHRGLYMNEATRERSAGFPALQQALGGVAAELADYVRQQTRG